MSKGASKGTGKDKDSEVVCWYCEKNGHRGSDCRKKQKDHDKGQSKGSKKGDSKGKGNKKELVQGQVLQVRQDRSYVEGSQVQRSECIQVVDTRVLGRPDKWDGSAWFLCQEEKKMILSCTGSRVSEYCLRISTMSMMNDYEEDLDDFPAENRLKNGRIIGWIISRRVDRSKNVRKWYHDEDSTIFCWINVLV